MQTREDLFYTESQRQANQHVLSQQRANTDVLKAVNAQQAQEIQELKAKLATAEAKNRQTDETSSGKFHIFKGCS